MNKEQEKLLLIVGIVVAIIIFAHSQKLFTFATTGANVSGYTLLSASNVQIQSKNPELNGSAVVLTLSTTGATDKAMFNFDGLTSNNYRATRGVLTVQMINQTMNYRVYEDEQSKYVYRAISRSADRRSNQYFACRGLSNCHCCQVGYYGGYCLVWWHCAGLLKAYKTARLSTMPVVQYKLKICLDNHCTIVDPKQNVANIHDDNGNLIARVTWAGNLMSNMFPPSPAIYNTPIRPLNKPEYTLKSTAMVNVMRNAVYTFGSEMGGCVNFHYHIFDCAHQYIDSSPDRVYNQMLSDFVHSKPQLDLECNFEYGNETYLSCKPISPIVQPVLQVLVKGDFIGLYIPEGKPKIISATQESQEPSQPTKLRITAQNIGTEADSFDFALDCPLQKVNLLSQRMSLNPNETKTLDLVIEGANSGQNCTLRMYSVSNPDLVDTKNVRIVFKPLCDLTPPNPNHIIVTTEKGCQLECKNQYTEAVDPITCDVLQKPYNDTPLRERAKASNVVKECGGVANPECIATKDPQNHMSIVAFGNTYSAFKYYEYIDTTQNAFIPQQKPHAHYIWWYGYLCDYDYKEVNGDCVKRTDSYVYQPPSPTTMPSATPTPTPSGNYTPTPTPTPTPQGQVFIGNTVIWIIAILGIIFVALYMLERRGVRI